MTNFEDKILASVKIRTEGINSSSFISNLRAKQVNELNRKKNKLSAEFLGRGGAWLDAGSIDDYYDTTSFVSAKAIIQHGFHVGHFK